MELFRYVWRVGFAPILPVVGLEALHAALRSDNPALVQGRTTVPQATERGEACEGADPIGFALWASQGHGATVGEVDDAFANACFEADQLLGEPAACRHFLNWWDATPRQVAIAELLAEVSATIDALPTSAAL